jgi:hypothetical protein
MTQHRNNGTKSSTPTAAPHGTDQPPSEHPLFKGMPPFEATMLRVAMQDLHEDGLGCRPFITATAELAPEPRRELLLRASAALLGHCDHHGAAECLKHALGLEHLEPSDELDQVVDDGLQAIEEAAEEDSEADDDDEDAWSTEDLIRIIDEIHQTPNS